MVSLLVRNTIGASSRMAPTMMMSVRPLASLTSKTTLRLLTVRQSNHPLTVTPLTPLAQPSLSVSSSRWSSSSMTNETTSSNHQYEHKAAAKKGGFMIAGLVGVATIIMATGTALAENADGQLFAKVYPKLDQVLTKMDRHEKLPKRAYLWGDDQSSNLASIDELLDEVISMLRVSDLNQPRQLIRKLEDEINKSQRRAAELREEQISAPVSKTLGMDSLPGFRTKEGYEDLIKAELANVDTLKKRVNGVKADFRVKAKSIGLEMTDDSLDALLESVSGDDLINMGIVFKNVKTVTVQLEKLTNQSGEHLDMAQRYYGMYVVLLKTLDRMQRQFVSSVDREFAPKLRSFIKEADVNIKEANDAIRQTRGDVKTLTNNIDSNKLTQQVAHTYLEYLSEQKQMITEKNRLLVDSLLTASNTYKTVTVSRNVAVFLQKGNENFSALMNLQMPELRAFENDKLRQEFHGLTMRMKAGSNK